MTKLFARLLLGLRPGVVHEPGGAGGGPFIGGQSCRYIALETDVMPGLDRALPIQAGDGCHLVDTTEGLTWDGAWWRKGRNVSTSDRGEYADRQRPRVAIAAPTAVRVDGGDVVTLDSTTTVPNDANSAIDASAIDTYAWAASPDVGVFANDAIADTTWTAPAAGAADQVVTLTLTATENYGAGDGGNISGSRSIEITVNAA